MSLFSTIQMSANALQVSQLGLHVVGNNISNANTPGYSRQELVQTSAVTTKYGEVIVRNGVRRGSGTKARRLWGRAAASNRKRGPGGQRSSKVHVRADGVHLWRTDR